MNCMMCLKDKEKVRYIDLYIIGSEGLYICHDCEMEIVEFVRQKRVVSGKDKIINYKLNKKKSDGIQIKRIK